MYESRNKMTYGFKIKQRVDSLSIPIIVKFVHFSSVFGSPFRDPDGGN